VEKERIRVVRVAVVGPGEEVGLSGDISNPRVGMRSAIPDVRLKIENITMKK